jgi:hypothetical protein
MNVECAIMALQQEKLAYLSPGICQTSLGSN